MTFDDRKFRICESNKVERVTNNAPRKRKYSDRTLPCRKPRYFFHFDSIGKGAYDFANGGYDLTSAGSHSLDQHVSTPTATTRRPADTEINHQQTG